MTDARLPTHLLVAALLRRANDSGGLGVVLARGDAQAGTVLAIVNDRQAIERAIDLDGRARLVESVPAGPLTDYWQRRRTRDADLWVVALDGPEAERFVAETMLGR